MCLATLTTLPVHEVQRAVRILHWLGHKTLGEHTRKNSQHSRICLSTVKYYENTPSFRRREFPTTAYIKGGLAHTADTRRQAATAEWGLNRASMTHERMVFSPGLPLLVQSTHSNSRHDSSP